MNIMKVEKLSNCNEIKSKSYFPRKISKNLQAEAAKKNYIKVQNKIKKKPMIETFKTTGGKEMNKDLKVSEKKKKKLKRGV